jgi:MipA family protein
MTLLFLFQRSHVLLAAGLFGITASPAFAQGQPGGDGAPRWALGIGASVRQLPYRGAERKTTGLPLLFYENQWVRFAGIGAEFKLFRQDFGDSQAITGGLKIKYEDQGYEADDAAVLRGMEERKGGLWGGAAAAWRNPVANVSVEWLSDLSGHSKGQKATLQLDRRIGFGALALTPRVQGQWMDRKYVDYYFGVRAAEALPDRAAYSGQSAWATEVGLRVDYALTAQHMLFMDMATTRLPDEIKQSPIVGRSSLSRVSAGYMYRF